DMNDDALEVRLQVIERKKLERLGAARLGVVIDVHHDVHARVRALVPATELCRVALDLRPACAKLVYRDPVALPAVAEAGDPAQAFLPDSGRRAILRIECDDDGH